MKVKLIGFDPYDYESKGERKFGAEIHCLVIDGMSSDTLVGVRTFSGALKNVELKESDINRKYELEMELREFRGELRAYPKALIPLE